MIRTITSFAAFAALTVSSAMAQDAFDAALGSYVDQFAKDCASLDSGTFDMPREAINKVIDVNGDGKTDPIVDAGTMSCSTSATLTAGGTGGRSISVFVSQPDGTYRRFELLGHGMLPIAVGHNTVLIVQKHASTCQLDGPAPCFAAYAWTGDGFAAGGYAVTATDQ